MAVGVTGRIVRTDVRLDFDDASGGPVPAAAHVAHENTP
jgi:hypothetical protein